MFIGMGEGPCPRECPLELLPRPLQVSPIPEYPTCPTPYQKKSMELPFSHGVVGVSLQMGKFPSLPLSGSLSPSVWVPVPSVSPVPPLCISAPFSASLPPFLCLLPPPRPLPKVQECTLDSLLSSSPFSPWVSLSTVHMSCPLWVPVLGAPCLPPRLCLVSLTAMGRGGVCLHFCLQTCLSLPFEEKC